MSVLEIKKTEAERARVFSARLDLELRAEELKDAIKKIEESIQIQLARENELSIKIKTLKDME